MAAVLAVIVGTGLLWDSYGNTFFGLAPHFSARVAEAQFVGRLSGPAEPTLLANLVKRLSPKQRFKLMTIRHIPRIAMGAPMPHPFVGACINCHLYLGGPGPGTQFKTPVGAVLEELSKVKKLGPPLLPTSQIPHPPAGRCIKCHDIVVKVPVDKKNGLLWGL
ncbi:MAG: magnetochrome domain-containing protein [Alphaproteobacteria bacterium]|nr:magnetochrome domain-containing protein [Alphaproteobacteria bacterium]